MQPGEVVKVNRSVQFQVTFVAEDGVAWEGVSEPRPAGQEPVGDIKSLVCIECAAKEEEHDCSEGC